MTEGEIEKLLLDRGQGKLLAHAKKLSARQRARLYGQIEQIDPEIFKRLGDPEERGKRGEISPIEGMGLDEIVCRRELFRKAGEEALRRGEVGAVLLAGGQGTRLGSDAPKGAFNIGLTRPLYIFECLIDRLKEVTESVGAWVPLFIMTSDKNDEETRAFWQEHDHFGYPPAFVRFFKQDMAPGVDFSGDLLLEEPDGLALSPNGNGGWYASLARTDILAEFPCVKWLNVFAVDNVLQRIADPCFIGATILSGKACGAKVVSKAEPHEKVGVLCLEDGLPSVVEYYELSEEMANAHAENGELLYRFGVILNYLFNLNGLNEVAKKRIPLHVVKKKIPYLDGEGKLVSPAETNGYKFETLILDMIRLMGSCLPYEVVREREFAPVKNRTGVDSVESARKLLVLNGVKL